MKTSSNTLLSIDKPLFSPIHRSLLGLLTITLIASAVISTLGFLGYLPASAGWAGVGIGSAMSALLILDIAVTCRKKAPPPSNPSETSPLTKQSFTYLEQVTPTNFTTEFTILHGLYARLIPEDEIIFEASLLNANAFFLRIDNHSLIFSLNMEENIFCVDESKYKNLSTLISGALENKSLLPIPNHIPKVKVQAINGEIYEFKNPSYKTP